MAAPRSTPVLPNLTVQQLEYLVAAADAPTRAAAAAGLGVTPSALTQGLAELERRVGLPLFERRGRQTLLRPDAAEHEAPRTRGSATLFPSFVLHRVTPVTGGTRWSLTLWAHGPAFR